MCEVQVVLVPLSGGTVRGVREADIFCVWRLAVSDEGNGDEGEAFLGDKGGQCARCSLSLRRC